MKKGKIAVIITALVVLTEFVTFGTITNAEEGGGNPYKTSLEVKNSPKSALYNVAKVSMQNAIASAVKEAPGRVVRTELDNENGYLVYSVEIADNDGNIKDVKVDAGNGKVLFVGDNPDEGDQGHDAYEDDDDGEKNDGKKDDNEKDDDKDNDD